MLLSMSQPACLGGAQPTDETDVLAASARVSSTTAVAWTWTPLPPLLPPQSSEAWTSRGGGDAGAVTGGGETGRGRSLAALARPGADRIKSSRPPPPAMKRGSPSEDAAWAEATCENHGHGCTRSSPTRPPLALDGEEQHQPQQQAQRWRWRRQRWRRRPRNSGAAAGGSSSGGGGGGAGGSGGSALFAAGLVAVCLLGPAAAMPPAVSEALRAGSLGHEPRHHHHRPTGAVSTSTSSRGQHYFDVYIGGSRSDGEGGSAGGGVAAATRRALRVSEKGAVGSGGGGEGGSGGGGGGGNKKASSKDDSEPKALEALVVGGNFTLHGKSTNVAQYDPVRCVLRAVSVRGQSVER